MSIEPGDYYLYAYDLERRPIGQKSLSNIPTEVVVQSAGTEAHKVSDDNSMPPHAYSGYVIHSGTSENLTANMYSRSTVLWR